MFVDYDKIMRNQMQHIIEEGLAKFFKYLNISSDSHVAHANQYASNSSATHVRLENLHVGMSLNYFPSQIPSARNTFLDREKSQSAMVLNPPMVELINNIPSSSTNC
jgi:hypothetical protein